MIALLDVNVLVAMFDAAHVAHEDAHRWFVRNRRRGWATCAVTLNGCVRVLSNPAYGIPKATPSEVISRLREFCASHDHQFWGDSASLVDQTLFKPDRITGHKQITDVYLLGLAVRRQGRLATFDRSIPLSAIVGARPVHLELVDSSLTAL